MTNWPYSLLQLCDSNFPTGTFSHSFGFETYIQERVILNEETFYKALLIYLEKQLVYVDGLAFRFVYEALELEKQERVLDWDLRLYVSCLTAETRDGNRRIGERMARLCEVLYPSKALLEYVEAIKKKEAFGHSACVFALVTHSQQIPKKEALGAYLFTMIQSLVQNAVRGIPLGQTDGQRILVKIQPTLDGVQTQILRAPEEAFGAVSPGLELAQIRHEKLPVRLFMS